MAQRDTIGELIKIACIWEVAARKVGNVHRNADFQGTSYANFVQSAVAISSCFEGAWTRSVGEIILQAVEATHSAVKQNTNLGIILILAPLAAADPEKPLKEGVKDVLASLTKRDASLTFEAIRCAKPGGLGGATEQDVRSEPAVSLLEAMRMAEERDAIARQYANNYTDIFNFGVPSILAGLKRFTTLEAAIVDLQLRWLEKEPDSLIARKNGRGVACGVLEQAAKVVKLGGIATSEGRRAGIELDRYLRSDGNNLNPGTTADLIAACLFAILRDNDVTPSTPFEWQVEDWL